MPHRSARRIALATVAAMALVMAAAQVVPGLITFRAGDAIKADEINHNFAWLDGRIDTVADALGAIEMPEAIPGPQGETGPQGEPGPKGDTGPTGETGLSGDTGPRGIPGERGPKGDTGDVGPAGATGETGPKGETGPPGLQGEPGPKGDTGATGPRGIQGEQGLKGDSGDTGPTGPTGETGPAGEAGPQGLQGIQGVRGEPGPKGDTGATGPAGPAGHQGIQGEQGPAGEPGGGVSLAGVTVRTHVETVPTNNAYPLITRTVQCASDEILLETGVRVPNDDDANFFFFMSWYDGTTPIDARSTEVRFYAANHTYTITIAYRCLAVS